MHILAITSEVPYPPDDGLRLRVWNLLCRLAKHERVSVLTWGRGDNSRSQAPSTTFHRLIELPLCDEHPGPMTRLLRHATFIAGGSTPPYVRSMLYARSLHSRSGRRAFAELVATYVRDEDVDVLTLDEEFLSCVALPRLSVPVVQHRLNLIAPTVRALRRRSDSGISKWLPDTAAWKRYDRAAHASADLIVAVTEELRGELTRLGARAEIVVVGNGVGGRPLATPPSKGHDIAFVGWMKQPPNIDAATWFVREVWSSIERVHPQGSFRVVGKEPSPAVQALCGHRVVVTGEVPDIADACEGVRIGVVPLRAGMGIKNKTLELLSLGVPVVATPPACEGISAGRDEGLVVVNGADEMTEALLWLLKDDDAVDLLGERARRFAQQHLSWDQRSEAYRHALHDLVDRSSTKAMVS